ncbi:hypothetical protein [Demequina sp. NBRC 110053]|uniref:hypothetical protein n=1 Tax=Demequina sp. NBRC 110053 TaxID=1570342 RepID=UPI001185DFF5|nr:hypothetical protein [Demequina sp. NBRC 110053]
MEKPAPRGNEERAEQINLQATADPTLPSRRVIRDDLERQKVSHALERIIGSQTAQREPRRSSYGMTAPQLRSYAAELMSHGWQAWECRARLMDPREVAA